MTTKNKTRYEMHVISNTHWDREWRWTFQKTRMMLVDVMDTLLDILEEHPEYACYHLDAQTVVIEDYLEIRPEKREQVAKFIQEHRIWSGPWYSAPDMNNISGESIIRNLLLGHKQARAFGEVMKVGYTPFSFGHVAQLPQVYAGFGIDSCMFYRGVGRERAKAEFWWEAPDGTRALTTQFSKRGRYNFYFHVYRPTVDGRPHNVVALTWDEMGLPVRCADLTNQYEPIYAMDHPPRFIKENIEPGIKALRDEDKDEFTTPYLLLMQGCDTTAPNPDEPRIIAEADACLEHDRVLHSNLPDYIAKLRDAVKDLPVLKGEMRVPAKNPGPSMIMQDTISARIYLKQANFAAQTRLERWAEPMAVLAAQFGQSYPLPFVELAWKYLLANQAHDSLAGCSIDEVHEDMMHRFAQCNHVADEVTRRSLSTLIKQIDASDLAKDGSLITIWNSLPHERRAVTSVTVDFPKDDTPASFALLDEEGNEIPLQYHGQSPVVASVQLRADWPQISYVNRHTVTLHGSVPAMGYRSFTVAPRDKAQRNHGTLRTAPNRMENEHLAVTFNANGTLDLTHKESGRVYEGLHFYDDRGECGTPWGRQAPVHDETVTSLGTSAVIEIKEEGPLRTVFCVSQTMMLPARSDSERRSSERAPLPIRAEFTLVRGCPYLEVTCEVDNTQVRDHYLRVLFPTNLSATHSHADRPFDVIERPVELPDSSEWEEPVRGNHPHNSWVDLSQGDQGLAVLTDGLPEYAVSDDRSRTVAITLLRTLSEVSPAYAFPPPIREGLQCLGKQTYRYALYPHEGDWQAGEVPRHAADFTAPLRAMQSGRHKGALPRSASFVSLSPSALVFSGIKPSESGDSLVVRFYNPTPELVQGTLGFHWPLKEAHVVSAEEERLESLAIQDDRQVPVSVPAKKIVTIEVVVSQ